MVVRSTAVAAEPQVSPRHVYNTQHTEEKGLELCQSEIMGRLFRETYDLQLAVFGAIASAVSGVLNIIVVGATVLIGVVGGIITIVIVIATSDFVTPISLLIMKVLNSIQQFPPTG